MALTPEDREWLKEASKPMSLDERAESDAQSLGAYIGREKELTSFEFTKEQIDRMKNEFGIDISD